MQSRHAAIKPGTVPIHLTRRGQNILYSSFSERPKHLDPAQSYSSNEVVFTGQIYEPPLQYHFLKRPYQLEPATVTAIPVPYYLDEQGQRLPDDASVDEIAYSVYDIEIQPGIHYQPHPAFAKDEQGQFLYHALNEQDLEAVKTLSDFRENGSRELVAADYAFQIKRLAHPRLHSPIFGLMSDYIVGLADYAATLKQAFEQKSEGGVRRSVSWISAIIHWPASRCWIVIATVSGFAVSIRSSSTGWRCLFLRRYPGRPMRSTRSRV